MTAQPAELPSNTPNPTPTNIPTGDKVLKDFKATLEVRWSEFDKATLEEAGGSSYFRNKDSDFIKAKATFDTAKAMLEPIQNDAQLKSDTKVLPTVEAALKSITDYLKEVKPEEKGKKINIILANTTADLSKFKADITGKLEDKKSAEDAKVSVATAIAAGGGTLASEAAEGLSKVVGEGAKDLGKEVAAIKKNPIKKIAEFFGFSETSIVGDFKSALAEKKEGGFGGFFGGIKVWFYGFLAKMFGVDIAKSLTPEELKLAGIASPTLSNKPEEVKPAIDTQLGKNKYPIVAAGITRISPEEAQKGGIHTLLALPIIKNMKLSEISQFSGKPKEFLAKINNPEGLNEHAANYLLRILFDKTSNLHGILQNRFVKVNPGKKIEEATVEQVLSSIGQDIHILSMFRNIDITDYQNSVQNLGKQFLSYDPTKGEVSGELVEKANSLGVSPILLAKFLALDNKQSFTDKKSVEALKSTEGLTEADKVMIDKIADFGVKFIQTIKTDSSLNLGNGKSIENIMAKKNILFGDIMKSYILTGGESDMSKMDTVHKIGAYTSFMLIVGQDSEASGALTGSIINIENAYKLFKDGKDPFDMIPEDVKTFFKDTISLDKIWDTISSAFGGIADYVKEYAKNSPGLTVFLVLAVLFLPIFSKKTNLSSILTGK